MKYRNKIIGAVVLAAVLIFTYRWGGNSPSLHDRSKADTGITENAEADTDKPIPDTVSAVSATDTVSLAQAQADETVIAEKTVEKTADKPNQDAVIQSPEQKNANTPVPPKATEKAVPNKTDTAYPPPVNPQDAVITEKEQRCTISVHCDMLLRNIGGLDTGKQEIIPKNGIVMSEREVVFYEGESVFNVLLREMKKNKIHLEFSTTPIFNSAYIEGIANLYEFDCGELSGWLYSVNGLFPNYGSSRYSLKNGDRIKWVYSCDLGKDVGANFKEGESQRDE